LDAWWVKVVTGVPATDTFKSFVIATPNPIFAEGLAATDRAVVYPADALSIAIDPTLNGSGMCPTEPWGCGFVTGAVVPDEGKRSTTCATEVKLEILIPASVLGDGSEEVFV
tara:strand:- start:1407 stop:1742 length:336 start_codon:yes stop_codon:yes gene_type:complete